MDDFSVNIVIILLILLLLVTILGINSITVFKNVIEVIYLFFMNIFLVISSALGYATGITLNETTEVVRKTSKFGIDIAADSIEDVGKILINASKSTQSLDTLKPKKTEGFTGDFDDSKSKIQNR